jgi:hypothetical protein
MHYRREDLEPAARADEQYLTIEEVAARYKVKSGIDSPMETRGELSKGATGRSGFRAMASVGLAGA